ncbi:MAG: HXXEE domain-containing protein [Bacteroides sp.]|nr:HXXEE domain-containing protein [Bacteroides sp.]
MSEFAFCMLLLPVVFMLHDFEEIVFFKGWMHRNGELLANRYPRLAHMVSRMRCRSTAAFSLGVAEEFLLISVVSFGAVYTGSCYLWLAVFAGFSLHLLIHIGQWLIWRGYTPAIVTTFLSFPYVIYVWIYIVNKQLFTVSEILLWGTGGFTVIIANLVLVHKLMDIFDHCIWHSGR